MFKVLISITITAIVSVVATFYLTGIYFEGVIHVYAEEDRLQNIALAQLLSEKLDNGEIESLRKEVNSLMTTSLVHIDPEQSYKYMNVDACKVHQLVYDYRATRQERYIVESSEEQIAQKVLQFWSEKDCDI